MKILLIHQNFPGQYLHLAQYLRNMGGHEIVGLGEAKNIKNRGVIQGITTIGYPTPEGAGAKTHMYLQSTEAAVRRGQAVARSLLDLKKKGFVPDVISVHPGWGEALFVRDIFPEAAILIFCEYYFRAGEADLGFDPEFPESPNRFYSVRFLNTPQLLSTITANACLSPTDWQASRYPDFIRAKMEIIHDGVDMQFMSPAPEAKLVIQPLQIQGESRVFGYDLPDELPSLVRLPENAEGKTGPVQKTDKEQNKSGGTSLKCIFDCGPGEIPQGAPLALSRKDKVITYIGRNLEPYRGFHIFLRSLPALQKKHPDAQILIVGKNGVSYSPALADGKSYKDKYLKEMGGKLDMSRIHFLGRIPYMALRALFCISSAHVYLTYPFVLSWSMMEAMSCESLVVASSTPPVQEVIKHGKNGLLVDFFDQKGLVDTLDQALVEPERFAALRTEARKTVAEKYELQDCLRRQYRLLEDLAEGRYPNPS